jgi:hypothetical protein
MQDNNVIAYKSRKLKEHERHHVTHDLELACNNTCTKNVATLFDRMKIPINVIQYFLKVPI